MRLDRVQQYLNQIDPAQENEIILDGPETLKGIMVSELTDIQRLSKLSSELITYLSKDVKRLTRKEQQSLWRDVEAVNARKEDFVFKMAQEANKNTYINQLLEIANKPNEKVITENGEVFGSSITSEQRNNLTAILVDLMNDEAQS